MKILAEDTTSRHPVSESDINHDFRNQPERDDKHDAAASGCDSASKAAKQTCPRGDHDCASAGSNGFAPAFKAETLRANVVALADRISRSTSEPSQDLTRDFEGSMKRIIIAAISILVAAGSFAPSTNASGPITGNIDFGGVVTFDTMSLASATRVTVWNSSFVLQDSGSFSTVAPGTNATMAPQWIFNPSTFTPALWKVGGFTFDLTSASVATQNANFLNVTGLGTVSGNGFDPTPGVWTFSSTNSNGSNSSTFGFQATTDPVPESSTRVLLTIGALGLAVLQYFQKRAQAR